MSPRTALLSIRRIGKGGWRRNVALLSAFGALMLTIGIVNELGQAPEAAAGTLTTMLGTAGTTGTPKAGSIVFTEDFEKSTSNTATNLTAYNSGAYTADAA